MGRQQDEREPSSYHGAFREACDEHDDLVGGGLLVAVRQEQAGSTAASWVRRCWRDE